MLLYYLKHDVTPMAHKQLHSKLFCSHCRKLPLKVKVFQAFLKRCTHSTAKWLCATWLYEQWKWGNLLSTTLRVYRVTQIPCLRQYLFLQKCCALGIQAFVNSKCERMPKSSIGQNFHQEHQYCWKLGTYRPGLFLRRGFRWAYFDLTSIKQGQ